MYTQLSNLPHQDLVPATVRMVSPIPNGSLERVVQHVFFPAYDPEDDICTPEDAHMLACAVHVAARAYSEHIDHVHKSHWLHITDILQNLQIFLDPYDVMTIKELGGRRATIISQLGRMKTGDTLAFPFPFPFPFPSPFLTSKVGACGVIFRKWDQSTVYEAFNMNQKNGGTRVTCCHPDQAIEIPNQVFNHENFRSKLAVSLCSTKPELAADLLSGVGHPIEPVRISKSIKHLSNPNNQPVAAGWSRSNLWYFIRVAIQSSLDRSLLGRRAYKAFILFFICKLANDAVNLLTNFPHRMISAKILRRFQKLDSPLSRWLGDTILRTCTSLPQVVNQRWRESQATQCSTSPWNSSQLDFVQDIRHPFHLLGYLSASPISCVGDPPRTLPVSRLCLPVTLEYFLSCPGWFITVVSDDDIATALHEIERVVGEEVDEWLACVTQVNKACEQLELFVHQYQLLASGRYCCVRDVYDPNHLSITILTIIELWVALDKLVIQEIPILADYSPEVPMGLLYKLHLRDDVTIHRLRRTHQYLYARHTRAHSGWSALSSNLTSQSFPCRYYDSTPCLQPLKASIQDVLPPEPLYAKVVLFELQCPVFFDVWRSITCWISPPRMGHRGPYQGKMVLWISALRPHILVTRKPSLTLFSNPEAPHRWDMVYYVYEGSSLGLESFKYVYKLPGGPYGDSGMQQYLDSTEHTSNEVLAARANRRSDLSLHEFIAFTHLRSGGSLQWLNILQELRRRTLNFRRQEVYLLFAQASSQVGPLSNNGELLWHQELEDPSFYRVLLGELESLFISATEGPMDGPTMAVISLLAGKLASGSVEAILDWTDKLLRDVRRKTFDWVHQVLHEVIVSPCANRGSFESLREMAIVCRSTFDVGCIESHELFCSTKDIEVALACAMIIHITDPPASPGVPTYSQVLLNRDRHLSTVLKGRLKNAIETDASDVGVDRAIQTIWPGYRPGTRRWEALESPNSQWLVCETAPTTDRRPQTMQINLLSGAFLVDGRPIGNRLPSIVTNDEGYRELFGSCNLLVVASDLPGMDFVTLSTVSTHRHRVHFAIWNDARRVVIRAQSEDTGDITELIPRSRFSNDLPPPMVERHVHWLSLSTSSVEIRPIEDPWKESSENWRILLQPSGNYHVKKGDEFLVYLDRRRPVWTMVSRCFKCLDDPQNLMISLFPLNKQLSITLPRYGLSFFVNEADNLESCDFKDMVYDEDQSVDTLFGLANRLVLRPKVRLEADLTPKLIIIPHGHSLDQRGHSTEVGLPATGPVKYHVFHLDRELGCLKGTVNSESRLYLARLHALTSGECRPEPLTGRTGIEEAISLVRSSTPPGTHGFLPQMCFDSATLQIHGHTYDQSELPTECALLQGAYLCLSSGLRSWEKPAKTLDQLLFERPPPKLRARDRLLCRAYPFGSPSPDVKLLRQLFSSLQQTNETALPFRSQYISRLHNSTHYFQAANSIDVTRHECCGKPSTEALRKYYVECRLNYMDSLSIVKEVLGPNTGFERILDLFGQWPRVTPFILFRCLASNSPIKLPESWKECLVSLALLALNVQRARRLLKFAGENLNEELHNELANGGHDGWDPAENSDWLLIQLQGDFLIRPLQTDVAKAMASPLSAKSCVMQVNMGEGKTSVIIPICAATLADGDRLVRVIVPKALIPQTLELLTDRLSGLVNKPIYHMTFSRNDGVVTGIDLERMHECMSECRDKCGIVVMQPEDILSLKLACVEMHLLENGFGLNPAPIDQKRGFEYVLNGLKGWPSESLTQNAYVPAIIGKMERCHRKHEMFQQSQRIEKMKISGKFEALVKIQQFLETHARDIIDESDHVLRPQFQLVYSTGYQHPLEGSPDRWVVAQQVLGIIKRHACIISSPDSHIIQCDGSSPGSFPHIHILQADGGEQLTSLIAQDVLDGHLSTLSFHTDLGLRGTIRQFMLNKDIHPDVARVVEKYARQSTSWSSLLLLRGLLAHNVLLFALTQRRWRVDYGLDPTFPPRTLLAIPYRAKDVPDKTAEFGHPDITILLTCLSYYYGGLSESQLRIAFDLLLQQDDPHSEYGRWVEDYDNVSLPSPLHKLSGINTRSSKQWVTYLVPLFARNKRAIDLYLSKFVFAKHVNEFPQRISASNWDIAERRSHLVTGLMGTNDGQYLLPTCITQEDPDHLHQTGTNARILAYLLRPENSSYMVTADRNSERWVTLKLLVTVVSQKPQIRVLLDVGAQILDFSNLQLAEAWLDCVPPAETAGAIYFDENDVLMVLARNGKTQPLSSSPLIDQLHRCVAYLDDAHTRGTDIKFPHGFRAAVTLGHKVTKDRLVQGCMRMRKLGHGHSVMFFAPHEVDQKIRSLVTKKDQSIPVTTSDILHWAIHETWNDIQQQAPFWALQGIAHQVRSEAWTRFCQRKASAKELADAWIQPELKSLADMYMPCHPSDHTSFKSDKFPRQIQDRCEAFGVMALLDVRMDEEQEREVSREIEREREVDLIAPKVSPAKHSVHPDVVTFVKTGDLPFPLSGTAFLHVFSADATGASSGPHSWSPYILATGDFCETIIENESVQGRVTDYLRPVQWVLSGKTCGSLRVLVLLSPFEANFLMPEIRISEHVHLHLYIPRTTKRMQPSDDLRLYSIPPVSPDWIPPWSLIDQLNVFAGQLYLSDFTSYIRLSNFLGVHTEDLPQGAGTAISCNWFSGSDSSVAEIKERFKDTPLPLALTLLAIRRGMDFSGTHMSRILDGLPLTKEDFESSPEDTVKAATGHSGQDQGGVPAELTFANDSDGNEQGPTMTRKRVSDLEYISHESKRRRRY